MNKFFKLLFCIIAIAISFIFYKVFISSKLSISICTSYPIIGNFMANKNKASTISRIMKKKNLDKIKATELYVKRLEASYKEYADFQKELQEFDSKITIIPLEQHEKLVLCSGTHFDEEN